MFRRLNDVLKPTELAELRTLLATTQFEDGAATAGPGARRAKRNLQASGKAQSVTPARTLVSNALMRHEDFRLHALPLRILPPLFSRYDPGMRYGAHTDNAVMGQDPPLRTDIAVTLFLTPPEDYDGGELTVGVDGAPQSVKLPAGSAVVYPATTLHRVEPVTRGQRLAAVTWVQSIVRDAAQRELLADLATALRAFQASAPNAAETLLLSKTRANLVRMWADL
jgi:PKHD-type hydroxylase